MKAFDSIFDKGNTGGGDSGFDLLTSRSLSREVDGSLRLQPTERDKSTVATNYFALACPIMPIGLLGVFMFLGKLGSMYEDDPSKLSAEETQRQRGDLTQALYVAAMRKKMETDKKLGDGSLQCSRPVDALMPLGDRTSIKKKKENALMLEGKQSERMGGPRLLTRAQSDVGKLVKAKMQLETHLDRISEEQDYSAVCRVSARLELLDKALKKLGAS